MNNFPMETFERAFNFPSNWLTKKINNDDEQEKTNDDEKTKISSNKIEKKSGFKNLLSFWSNPKIIQDSIADENPIILNSNLILQIFNWDELFDEQIIRSFSIFNFLQLFNFTLGANPDNSLNKSGRKGNEGGSSNTGNGNHTPQSNANSIRKSKSPMKESKTNLRIPIVPRYFTFYSTSTIETLKQFNTRENLRKSKLSEKLYSQLNHPDYHKSLRLHGNLLTGLPFHNTLFKFGTSKFATNKNFKYTYFLDIKDFAFHPNKLLKMIKNNCKNQEFPIVIIPIADLLNLSKSLFKIWFEHSGITFLAILEDKIKIVMKKLIKIQENYLSNYAKKITEKSPYQFLMTAINSIKQELNVSIYIFNPPYPYDNSTRKF